MKKEKPFNNPFANLKLEPKKPAESKKAAAPAPPPKARKPAPLPQEDDDAALFLASVGEVERVKGPARVAAKKDAPKLPPRPPEEDDVLTELSELIAGEGPFELSDTEAHVEGWVSGLDRRILIKLRRGEYPVQGRLDLHGMNRSDARDALERFVVRCRQERRRCVLVVHGRGLHSPEQGPVLKELVQEWLAHGRLSKLVLAFSSARPQDGGGDALYVLLRR